MSWQRRNRSTQWNPFGPPQPRPRVFSVPPPARVAHTDLRDLLEIYDGLCGEELRDPRNHRVRLTPERFPHMINLKELDGKRDVRNPQKEVELIRSGKKTNDHFGGFENERAETLTWIRATIRFPTIIVVRSVVPGIHPGTELYYKEFDQFGGKLALLVCRRVGPELLVPVTWFPKNKRPKEHEIVYHALPIRL
jgi:hypothetical protein